MPRRPIFVEKSTFLPLLESVRGFLPYRLRMLSGVIVICGLQRLGLMPYLGVTKAGIYLQFKTRKYPDYP